MPGSANLRRWRDPSGPSGGDRPLRKTTPSLSEISAVTLSDGPRAICNLQDGVQFDNRQILTIEYLVEQTEQSDVKDAGHCVGLT
jgi:hypothetical protein